MDSVFDSDAALLEYVCELAHCVLRLRGRESITRHEHDLVCAGEVCGDVVKADFAHRSLLLAAPGYRCRYASERAEQNVRHRSIHRAAQEDREYESGKTVERAGDDQHFIREHEAGR